LGGDDLLQGFGGDDFLYGGTGSDKIYDGGGADWIVSEDDGKADTVDCGSGVDAVKASPTEQIDTYVGCERFVY
jgi:Ca2+-binding RTX toxin-like protein